MCKQKEITDKLNIVTACMNFNYYLDEYNRKLYSKLGDNYKNNFFYDLLNKPGLFFLNNKNVYYIGYYLPVGPFISFNFNQGNYKEVFENYGLILPSEDFIESLIIHRKSSKNIGKSLAKYLKYKIHKNIQYIFFDYIDNFRLFDENLVLNENFGESIVCSFDKKAIEINNIRFQKIKIYTNSEYAIFHDYVKWCAKEYIKAIRKNINIESNSLEENSSQNINIFQFNIKKAENFILFLDIAEIINKKNIAQIEIDREKMENKPNSSLKVSFKKKEGDEEKCFGNLLPEFVNDDKSLYEFALSLKKIGIRTSGDLNKLAKIIARINSKNKIKSINEKLFKPKATVIFTKNKNQVIDFFKRAYNESAVEKNIVELFKAKGIYENIKFKMNGGLVTIIDNSYKIKEEHITKLRKVILSKLITVKDSVAGQLNFNSDCHYLILIDKQEELRFYKNHINGLVDIMILDDEVDSIEDCEKSCSPLDFLHLTHKVLCAYGLLLIARTEKIEKNNTSKIKLSTEDIFADFFKRFCEVGNGFDCYADELYFSYESYFKNIYGVDPEKRKSLVNYLKSNYDYCRLRHSRNDNKWGFKGFRLKENKVEVLDDFQKQADEDNDLLEHLKLINSKFNDLINK